MLLTMFYAAQNVMEMFVLDSLVILFSAISVYVHFSLVLLGPLAVMLGRY